MNNNIITKERLIESKIENDYGLLRNKFLNLAEEYGFCVDNPTDWYDYKYIYIEPGFCRVDTTEYLLGNVPELTLEDFRLHEEDVETLNATQAPVDNDTLDTHKHTLEDNKRSTGVPSPIIIEDGSACDTRKDVFREMLTLAQENNCFIQFDGFTEDENDCMVVTFAASDDEYVVQSASDFKKLIAAQETLNKFLRRVGL